MSVWALTQNPPRRSWGFLALLCAILPSLTSAQTDLEKQVIACGSLSVCTITVPSGVNITTVPWALRDKAALTIRGDGSSTIVWSFATDPPPTVCLDTSGSANVVVEDVTFSLGNASKRPAALWVHGRSADAKSQRVFWLRNVEVGGWFTAATVAWIALENEEVHSTNFWNGIPNTTALFLGRDNPLGVTSPFGPIRVNTATMTATNHLYVNTSFNHEGHVGLIPPANNDQGFGLTLGSSVFDLTIIGGSTSGGARGGVLRISGLNNRRVAVVSPNWESESARASIVVDGDVFGLTVRDGLLQCAGPALRVNGLAANVRLEPAEMLCPSILALGPAGKLTGNGLIVAGLSGR